MDQLYYQAVDLLKSLIAIPSISRDEKVAADFLEQHMLKEGLKPQRHGNNIFVLSSGFDSSLPTLLLNSHIDTVRPNDGWTRDPFTPSEEDDRIYGLGSNDAGASLVSLLAAFIHMDAQPRSYNMVFLASCEEEVSGKNGIELALKYLPPITVAIVGEPTGMNPAIAEKGLMALDGEIDGVSGHAARNEGVNAIYKAMDVIDTLKNLRFPTESPPLGPVKISVTQIEAGTQHNVVPAKCKIVVDVRTTDAYSNEETLHMIRAAVPECRLVPRSTRLNPSSISPEHPIVTRLEMMGATPFGSPTLSDQALMPWQSVKLGPGDSARSHSADEFVYSAEIRNAIARYVIIMSNLCI